MLPTFRDVRLSWELRVGWKWRPTETNRLRTLPCWPHRTLPKNVKNSASQRYTSRSVGPEDPRHVPQDPVHNLRYGPWHVTGWRSDVSKTSHPSHPIVPVVRVDVVVVVFKRCIAIPSILTFKRRKKCINITEIILLLLKYPLIIVLHHLNSWDDIDCM
jgi:hypothetical protein